ncbi:hypothetical protein CROQUDRAFT_97856 [Cronartium quercuum f. sp. fusiforme G11]|uniref:Uncharacterized protein n=1 Tax=Cronartium quercuum f. sp. fusiforme G11 TaxID=708437 RepID=A0A9P6N9P1_9BASI|nr:hypothetical protein CROQUDRAFT_97856 [Cronartium quercuum f. sp. fusiforme G11]
MFVPLMLHGAQFPGAHDLPHLTFVKLHLINSMSDKDLVSPPKFDLPRLTHLNLKTT